MDLKDIKVILPVEQHTSARGELIPDLEYGELWLKELDSQFVTVQIMLNNGFRLGGMPIQRDSEWIPDNTLIKIEYNCKGDSFDSMIAALNTNSLRLLHYNRGEYKSFLFIYDSTTNKAFWVLISTVAHMFDPQTKSMIKEYFDARTGALLK